MFRIVAVAAAGLTLAACGGAAASRSRAPASSVTPAVNPQNFVPEVNNAYFPLKPGTILRYKGEKDEKRAVDVFEVTHQKKVIEGVSTTVIHDQLFLGGKLEEVTIDWYAQDRRGNVWYFGEATKTLKRGGEVLSTEGSWQAGVEGARAGIFFPGDPQVGLEGQQEFFKGQAEDHFKVLSLKASVSVPYVTTDRALKTREFTPLEPEVLDNKYYVAGIGTVLELAVKGPAERLELFARETP